jgi:outer membrane protein assembly factor BamB
MCIGGMDGYLYCLDITDGSIVYKYDLGAGVIDRSQTVSDGKIYVADYRDQFYVFKAGPEPELLWQDRLPINHPGTPTPYGNRLIISSPRGLTVYRKNAGDAE